MSDSEDGPPSKRAHAEAIVVALPQGEAQERIDCFLAENSKLAAEIVQLRQMSRGGGIAEIYEKNKQLEAEVQERVKQITELESAHAAAIKTNQAKYEKELRVLRIERKYVDVHVYCWCVFSELEEELSEIKESLIIDRDAFDTKEHEWRIQVEGLRTEVALLRDENLSMSEISKKLVRNVWLLLYLTITHIP